MAGRKPKVRWTPSLNQFTVTVGGKLHRLGTDREAADEQSLFLLHKHDRTEPATTNPTFAMVLAALNWAASERVRLIASDPLRGLLELPEGRSRGGEAVWSPEVFQLVLANVNVRFQEYLRAVAWTGARPESPATGPGPRPTPANSPGSWG